MSEGMRAALAPDVEHMPTAVFFTAMIAVTAMLLRASLGRFRQPVVA